jgi:hypothetical protein
VQCCPEIIPALYVQPKIRRITKDFGKHQSPAHRQWNPLKGLSREKTPLRKKKLFFFFDTSVVIVSV